MYECDHIIPYRSQHTNILKTQKRKYYMHI